MRCGCWANLQATTLHSLLLLAHSSSSTSLPATPPHQATHESSHLLPQELVMRVQLVPARLSRSPCGLGQEGKGQRRWVLGGQAQHSRAQQTVGTQANSPRWYTSPRLNRPAPTAPRNQDSPPWGTCESRPTPGRPCRPRSPGRGGCSRRLQWQEAEAGGTATWVLMRCARCMGAGLLWPQGRTSMLTASPADCPASHAPNAPTCCTVRVNVRHNVARHGALDKPEPDAKLQAAGAREG